MSSEITTILSRQFFHSIRYLGFQLAVLSESPEIQLVLLLSSI